MKTQVPPFIYIGDPDVLGEPCAPARSCRPNRQFASRTRQRSIFGSALPVLAIAAGADVIAGKPDAATAQSTIAAIRIAVEDTIAGKTSAVVTCPIAKSVLYSAGFKFPGHTEYLADLASNLTGKASQCR